MTEYHIRRDALGFYYHTPIEEDVAEEGDIEEDIPTAEEPIPLMPVAKKRGRKPKHDSDCS